MTPAVLKTLLSLLAPGGRRARLMIMTFHQVPEMPDPLMPGEPDGAAFEKRMRLLQSFCNVLPLPEAARALRDAELPPRAACVTFDDGYLNNSEVAAPILRKLGIPATFFIAVNAIESGIMWNDMIIEGVRRAGPSLDLVSQGLETYSLGNVEERRNAIGSIIDAIKYRPMAERLAIAQSVFSAATSERLPRLMMTEEEVAGLGAAGFDIGAHTVNHPILKELSDAEAEREISGSFAWVERVNGGKPKSFAYPNGRPGVDYTSVHVGQVADAGFEVAVSTRWACADRRSGAFELPRFSPWETDAAGFGTRLVKTALRSYLPGE